MDRACFAYAYEVIAIREGQLTLMHDHFSGKRQTTLLSYVIFCVSNAISAYISVFFSFFCFYCVFLCTSCTSSIINNHSQLCKSHQLNNQSRQSFHGLYSSTSCCISQWPSQWGWANFDPPPTAPKPLIRLWWNSNLRTTIWRPPKMQNFISIRRRGWVVLANTQFATVRFLSLSFFFGLFFTRTGCTGGLIFTIYTSYDVFLPKDVPFGVSLILLLI